MNIIKYGHSCLLIEERGVHILIDPGKWNKLPNPEKVDALLITHEHLDHFDIEQIQTLHSQHPQMRIITHESVGNKLDEFKISYEIIEPGAIVEVNGVSVESYGIEHNPIIGTVSPCRNTGYFIAKKIFAPGDAFLEVPRESVEILALPVAGPWVKLSEALEYAKKLKPKIAFPIHDAIYQEWFRSGRLIQLVVEALEPAGITFVDLSAGSSRDF